MSSLKDRNAVSEGAPVIAVWREPFTLGEPTVEMWRPGMTVYEIVKAMKCLPADFEERGWVMINGHEVNRGAWHLVRPKGSTSALPIAVTFHMPLRGGRGGGGSGKMIVGIVAMLALTVLTAGIASAGWAAGAATAAGFEGLFLAGSMSAKILAGAVGLMGALAIAALTKPPTAKPREQDNGETPESASAEGNVLAANAAIPRVIGTRKVFPPLACEPQVLLVGEDEFVKALYVLNGPHKLEDIKIGKSSISDDINVEYQVFEGWPSDERQSLVGTTSRTRATNLELKKHRLSGNSGFVLADAVKPLNCIPQWQRFTSNASPDEVHIHLLFASGLTYAPDPTLVYVVAPFRLRFRKEGDTAWINAPEIHFRGYMKANQGRAQIIIKWDAVDTAVKAASSGAGWGYARTTVPPQAVAPVETSNQWEAHSHFYSGSGDVWLGNTNLGSTGVRNMAFDANGAALSASVLGGGSASPAGGSIPNCCNIYLDSAAFPKGYYEFEIMQGESYANSNFTQSTYVFSSNVRNFFKFNDAGGSVYRTHQDQSGIVDTCIIQRCVSVWHEQPIPTSGFATIALLAKNKAMQQLSVKASGYVQDWDGTGWNNWTVTSNPAPHYRDILVGRQNVDPVPLSIVDDQGILAWRTDCITKGYTCDTIVEGARLEEVLGTVANCGYAQPYWSDRWSVVRDYDRSAESPVQVFSPRNSRGFKFRKAFPRLPDGLLLSYRSDSDDYQQRQVAVYRMGVPTSDARIEQASYEGLVDEAKIIARGQFDLKQGEYRSTFYSLEAPVEAIVCRRGSLVAVQHDIVTKDAASARILSVELGSGVVLAIKLDAYVDLKNTPPIEDVTAIEAVEAIEDVGVTMGCSIRHTDGTITTHALSNATGRTDRLVFETPYTYETWAGGPFDNSPIGKIGPGCLVTIGPLGSEYTRLLVTEIIPGPDLTARLTMVDEAPELWA